MRPRTQAHSMKNWHIIGWLVLFVLLACYSVNAHAQTPPTLTFTAQNTVGAGTVTPVLTWSTTPAAQSCTASGDPAWAGTKAASGTQTLAAISSTATYSLLCTWPGDTTATISWTAPTTNTDGSALAKCASSQTTGPCLKSFLVARGTDQTNVGSESMPVNDPNATSFAWTGLPVGTHWFSVVAVNADGIMSDQAKPFVSKVITASSNVTRNVTITVNPKPSAATALAVK